MDAHIQSAIGRRHIMMQSNRGYPHSTHNAVVATKYEHMSVSGFQYLLIANHTQLLQVQEEAASLSHLYHYLWSINLRIVFCLSHDSNTG